VLKPRVCAFILFCGIICAHVILTVKHQTSVRVVDVRQEAGEEEGQKDTLLRTDSSLFHGINPGRQIKVHSCNPSLLHPSSPSSPCSHQIPSVCCSSHREKTGSLPPRESDILPHAFPSRIFRPSGEREQREGGPLEIKIWVNVLVCLVKACGFRALNLG
jgi:hypothetical protein